MATDNHILEILKVLRDAEVEFIIGGGVAAVLHGVERATMDLDLSVRLESSNVRSFLNVIKSLGMTPRVPISGEILGEPEKVNQLVKEKGALVFTFIHPQKPFQQIDVFLDPKLSYETLLKDSDTLFLGSLDIKVLSKIQLIQLKEQVRPVREKDLVDIRALKKLLEEK
jgi:hypothetical protein